jgi:hypothetical protein
MNETRYLLRQELYGKVFCVGRTVAQKKQTLYVDQMKLMTHLKHKLTRDQKQILSAMQLLYLNLTLERTLKFITHTVLYITETIISIIDKK